MQSLRKKRNSNRYKNKNKMATKHYLSYLQETMRSRWNCLAMKDLDGVNSYTYAELAAEIEKLHDDKGLWRKPEGNRRN